jgi:AraC-like DNA-binding protein
VLLGIPTKSLSEVAYEAGYSVLSSFDRDFKALVRTTPGIYRMAMFQAPGCSPEKRIFDNLFRLYLRSSGPIIELSSPS